jgi:hypothetical protein
VARVKHVEHRHHRRGIHFALDHHEVISLLADCNEAEAIDVSRQPKNDLSGSKLPSHALLSDSGQRDVLRRIIGIVGDIERIGLSADRSGSEAHTDLAGLAF